jgi:hypothetical protein
MDEGQEWEGNTTKFTFYDRKGYRYYLTFDSVANSFNGEDKMPPVAHSSNIFSIPNIENWIRINKKPFVLVGGQVYKSATTKLLFKCKKCHPDEIPFSTCWRDIQVGHGCGLCVNAQIGLYNNLKFKYSKISEEWDYERNFPIRPEHVSPHSRTKYYWICPDCKNSYPSDVCHRTGDEARGCPVCSESNGEKRIRKFLEYLKKEGLIEDFKSQKKFPDCRNQLELPFDFQIFTKEGYFLCEYHGIQHYKSIKFFGGDEQFKLRKKLDKIKLKYCKDNNIPLLVIPYWDFDNIESILQNALGL